MPPVWYTFSVYSDTEKTAGFKRRVNRGREEKAMPERPRGRERGEIKGSGGVNLKGSGLGTGPKGAKDGYSGRPSGDRPGGTGSSGGGTSSGGGRQTRGSGGGGVSPLVFLIILVVAFLGGGKAGVLDMLTGGGSGSSSVATTPQQDYQPGHQNETILLSGPCEAGTL